MKLFAPLAVALALAACNTTGGLTPNGAYNLQTAYGIELKAANLAADSGKLSPADAKKVVAALKTTHDALAAGDLIGARAALSEAQNLTPK